MFARPLIDPRLRRVVERRIIIGLAGIERTAQPEAPGLARKPLVTFPCPGVSIFGIAAEKFPDPAARREVARFRVGACIGPVGHAPALGAWAERGRVGVLGHLRTRRLEIGTTFASAGGASPTISSKRFSHCSSAARFSAS